MMILSSPLLSNARVTSDCLVKSSWRVYCSEESGRARPRRPESTGAYAVSREGYDGEPLWVSWPLRRGSRRICRRSLMPSETPHQSDCAISVADSRGVTRTLAASGGVSSGIGVTTRLDRWLRGARGQVQGWPVIDMFLEWEHSHSSQWMVGCVVFKGKRENDSHRATMECSPWGRKSLLLFVVGCVEGQAQGSCSVLRKFVISPQLSILQLCRNQTQISPSTQQ